MPGRKVPIEFDFTANYIDVLRALKVISDYYNRFAQNQVNQINRRLKALEKLKEVEEHVATILGRYYGGEFGSHEFYQVYRAHVARTLEKVKGLTSRINREIETETVNRQKRILNSQLEYYRAIFRNERASLKRRLEALKQYENVAKQLTTELAKSEAKALNMSKSEYNKYLRFRLKSLRETIERERQLIEKSSKERTHREALTRYQSFVRARVQYYRSLWKDTDESYRKRLEYFEKYKEAYLQLERSIAREEARRLKLGAEETRKYVAMKERMLEKSLDLERKSILRETRFQVGRFKTILNAYIEYNRSIWRNESESLTKRREAFNRYAKAVIALTERMAKVEAQALKFSELQTKKFIQYRVGQVRARLAKEEAELLGGAGTGFKLWRRLFGPAGLAFTLVRLEIVGRAIFRVWNWFRDALRDSLETLEQFKVTTISIAAILTSLAEVPKEKLHDYFKGVLQYAQDLYDRMIILSRGTLLTTEQSMKLVEAFAMFGQVADLSNKKALEGLRAVINAVALLTKGQRLEIQLRQEIRGLLTQTGLQFTMIYQVLKAMNPEIDKQLKLWIKEGTVIEHVGEYLRGFGIASEELANTLRGTWTTVKSIFSQKILREAVKPLYDALVEIGNEVIYRLVDNIDTFNFKLTETGRSLVELFRSAFEDIAMEARMLFKLINTGFIHLKDTFLGLQALGAGLLWKWLFGIPIPTKAIVLLGVGIGLVEKLIKTVDRYGKKWLETARLTEKERKAIEEGTYDFSITMKDLEQRTQNIAENAKKAEESFKFKFTPRALISDLLKAQEALEKLNVNWRDFTDVLTLSAERIGLNIGSITNKTYSEVSTVVDNAISKLNKIYTLNMQKLSSALKWFRETLVPKEIFTFLAEEFKAGNYFQLLANFAKAHKMTITSLMESMYSFYRKMGTLLPSEVPAKYLEKMGLSPEKNKELLVALSAGFAKYLSLVNQEKEIQQSINTLRRQYNELLKKGEDIKKQSLERMIAQKNQLKEILEAEKKRLEQVMAEYKGRASAEEQLKHQLEAVDRDREQRIANIRRRIESLKSLSEKERDKVLKDAISIENKIADVRKKLLKEQYDETYTFVGGIKKALEDMSQSFTKTGEWIYNTMMNAFQRLEEGISQFFFDAMMGKLKSFKDYVTEFFRSIAVSLMKLYADYMARLLVTNIAGGLKLKVSGGGGGLFGGFLGHILSGLFGGLFVGSQVPSGTVAPPRYIPKTGWVVAVKEGGILPGTFVKLKSFAEGDIVKRPTIGLIAEAGYPEAVIPLKHGYIPVRLENKEPQVIINVENKTDLPLSLQEVNRTFDGKRLIIDTVIEALHTNYDFRSTVKQTVLGGA